MKRSIFLLLLLAPLVLNAEVYHIAIQGPIDSVSAEYVIDSMARIRSGAGADLVVIELDTPGGLDSAMRTTIQEMLKSPAPVVVYVYPQGARAASAGFFIAVAADIAAMAPGTNMGAASPVSALGQKIDDTMKAKITNDAVSYIRSLARQRGRDEDMAARAVSESLAYTADECLKAGLADLIAENFDDLMRQLHGRRVTTTNGETVTLDVKDSPVIPLRMSWRQRFLRTITNPNLAYFLLIFGLIGLYLEFTHAGAVIPGVIGGISLLLAFMAFQILPINYVGLLLILLAIGLFLAEIKVQGFGILGLGGAVAFFLGSVILVSSPIPEMRPTMSMIIILTFSFAAIILFLTYKVFQSMKRRIDTGQEGLAGEIGTTRTRVTPEGGRVFVHGEWWNAFSDSPIEADTEVEVLQMDGFRLKVKPRGG
ncbi:MAG: nodulation protein NfeD [Acidobacteriota bacterium]|jgi:membrane-bound serine protease (ClpP class)|nr:nodulation protein NfeD [Acidobacteriota bacterium]